RLSAVAYIRALPRRSQVAAGCAGVVFAAGCFARFGLSAHALIGAILSVVLVVLTAIDLQRRLLPDVIVLPALAAVLILQLAFYPDHAVEWVLACLGAALFFFVPLLVYPAGMGMGDVKLAALLGAGLGKSVVDAILAAVLLGAAFAVLMLVSDGRGGLRQGFAFGSLLVVVTVPLIAMNVSPVRSVPVGSLSPIVTPLPKPPLVAQ